MSLYPTYTINGGSTTKYIQGWNQYRNPYVYTTNYVAANGATVPHTLNEAIYNVILSGSNAILHTVIYCNQEIQGYTNNTPTICDTTNFPDISSIQNGIGSVTINTENGPINVPFVCSTSYGGGSGYLTAYASGSMAKALHDLVVGAVGSRTTPDPSFMNVNQPFNDFILNTNQYTKDIIDLTPMTVHVPGVYPNNFGWPIMLISPRHVVSATHVYAAQPGSVHIFRDKNGNEQTVTVLSKTELYGDVTISYLDQVVTGITPYSILPNKATTRTKLPIASVVKNTPIAPLDNPYHPLRACIYGFYVKQRVPFGGGDWIRQVQLGVTNNISPLLGEQVYSPQPYLTITNTNDIRYPYSGWNTQTLVGDSGSPMFLPTGLTTATGTPLTIYLGTEHPEICSLSFQINEVNTAMNTMAGTSGVYALDEINVSQSAWWNSFNTY